MSPQPRDIRKEDPLGLHEIRKKMERIVPSLVLSKNVPSPISIAQRVGGETRSDVILMHAREGMDRFHRDLEEKELGNSP